MSLGNRPLCRAVCVACLRPLPRRETCCEVARGDEAEPQWVDVALAQALVHLSVLLQRELRVPVEALLDDASGVRDAELREGGVGGLDVLEQPRDSQHLVEERAVRA